MPEVTWTKQGVPQNVFNVSGHQLRLVNVQRKDAGSYRCTAKNAYGKDTSKVSIIGVKCSQCQTERVNVTLKSQRWNESLLNKESSEFKTMESNILSAIFEVYAKNSGKQLHRLVVKKFSPGSVVATVEMLFGRSACEPLKPLQDELASAKLGQYTVDRQLYVLPPVITPTTTSLNSSSTVLTSAATTRPKTPAMVEADDEWEEERVILHATYLTVIGLLLLSNIFLVIFLCRRRTIKGPVQSSGSISRRKENGTLEETENQGIQLQGAATYVNTSGEVKLADPELSTLQSTPSEEGNQSIYDACNLTQGDATKRYWEVNREHVHIVKDIGKGAFSQVAKAEAWNICGIRGLTTVAVKMLKENAPDSDRKDLLSELELMKQLKNHPHVIKLMGCVTESDPILVLIEYIPYGDLLGFLRKSRGVNDTYYKDPDVKPQTSLTSQQMMQFAWQIADGMSYLSSNKIIHRDLAARNVLVGGGEKCKVTDFGMARNVQGDDIYTKRSRGRLPAKWTAYEALLYGTYTTQSDVWSFGVVLYEIFTVGGSPYPGINGHEIANRLKKGYRMPKPKHVDQQLYKIMLQCWQQKPNDRPTFPTLKDKITDLLENSNETYVNLQEYDTSDCGYIDDLLE